VTLVETGDRAGTGARLLRAQQYIEGDTFLFNYSDGLSNVDLDALVAFHHDKGKVATLTGFHPRSRYGVIQTDDDNLVRYWQEKPLSKDLTSGGFFVMNRRIFDYLEDEDACILETRPLERLAGEGELALYVHHDFWFSMDTYKEALMLNEMWARGEAPWKLWS
jgi:glucose-1-phosphate cytidylyltransferase